MILVAEIQLRATPYQKWALERTLREANKACDWLSEYAFETKTFRHYALHKLAYTECRKTFERLGSQVVVRCLAKVADAYKLDRDTLRTFQPLGAIAYDARLLTWEENDSVAIWTVQGRQSIPFVCGKRQRALLQHVRGESELIMRDGRFYLAVSVEVPEPVERLPAGWMGVDLGIVNIATTSLGQNAAGAVLNTRRQLNNKLRRRLQQKGTQSAKRLLKKRRRKESRFSRHTNHHVSKQIVATAERTGLGIALENLEGIRLRVRASRSQRRALHSWAFRDLQSKIEYKARMLGIPVCYVDPRNTSCQCRICGHCEKANRRTRDMFVCRACGHTEDADIHAACNIASRADVDRPCAGGVEVGIESHGAYLQSPLL